MRSGRLGGVFGSRRGSLHAKVDCEHLLRRCECSEHQHFALTCRCKLLRSRPIFCVRARGRLRVLSARAQHCSRPRGLGGLRLRSTLRALPGAIMFLGARQRRIPSSGGVERDVPPAWGGAATSSCAAPFIDWCVARSGRAPPHDLLHAAGSHTCPNFPAPGRPSGRSSPVDSKKN